MALTEDLTWQLGDDGFVLNADVDTFPFVDIKKVSGLDSAPYRESMRDHEGVDGGFLDAEFEQGRSITLEGMGFADIDDIEDLLDTLKENFAPSKVLKPFYYKPAGKAERVLFVKPQGVRYDLDEALRTGTVALRFSAFAEIPLVFENVLQSFDLSIGATTFPGRGYPFGFDFGYGGVSSTVDAILINNNGNRATPPVFTITGPIVNPQIVSDTSSRTLSFNITLDVGETLVIDPYYKTVRLNGVTNRRNTLLSPTWFFLEKGENSIRFRAESGSGTLNIKFRAAWR